MSRIENLKTEIKDSDNSGSDFSASEDVQCCTEEKKCCMIRKKKFISLKTKIKMYKTRIANLKHNNTQDSINQHSMIHKLLSSEKELQKKFKIMEGGEVFNETIKNLENENQKLIQKNNEFVDKNITGFKFI